MGEEIKFCKDCIHCDYDAEWEVEVCGLLIRQNAIENTNSKPSWCPLEKTK